MTQVKEFVGITHLGNVNASLKREALLFNRLGICLYERTKMLTFNPNVSVREIADELDWLIEQGIVFDIEKIVEREVPDDEYVSLLSEYDRLVRATVKDARSRLDVITDESLPIINEFDSLKDALVANGDTQKINYFLQRLGEFRSEVFSIKNVVAGYLDLASRLHSVKFRVVDGIDAFPLSYNSRLPPNASPATKADVVRLVIDALPVPDENTPWEQILEYRADPDSTGKFWALRNWMSEMVRSELTPTEVQEKLETLLYEYQKHLKLHRIKAKTGKLEAVVVGAAEFLEDLANKRFSKIAKGLFQANQRQIELLQGELTAPGKELAYIVNSREKFSGTDS